MTNMLMKVYDDFNIMIIQVTVKDAVDYDYEYHEDLEDIGKV